MSIVQHWHADRCMCLKLAKSLFLQLVTGINYWIFEVNGRRPYSSCHATAVGPDTYFVPLTPTARFELGQVTSSDPQPHGALRAQEDPSSTRPSSVHQDRCHRPEPWKLCLPLALGPPDSMLPSGHQDMSTVINQWCPDCVGRYLSPLSASA